MPRRLPKASSPCGQLDAVPHLWHAREQRQRPGGREHVDPDTGLARGKELVERLRHDHVADPGRTDDEQLSGHAC